MIIGIGCDIIDHTISEKREWNTNLESRLRIFSERELKLLPSNFKQQILFLSGRFAAKEAVLKSLGTGMIDGISLTEIEILRDVAHKPTLELNGLAYEIASKKEITKWHLTISHTKSVSIAFAVAENAKTL